MSAQTSSRASKSSLPFRRFNSVIERPDSRESISKGFTSPVSKNSFKRPADLIEPECKKPKACVDQPSPLPASVITIDDCIDSFSDNQNLTADGLHKLLLPTVAGNAGNHDLNNVDCRVVADLINGRYKDQVRGVKLYNVLLNPVKRGTSSDEVCEHSL